MVIKCKINHFKPKPKISKVTTDIAAMLIKHVNYHLVKLVNTKI